MSKQDELTHQQRRAFQVIQRSMQSGQSDHSRAGRGAPIRSAFLANDSELGVKHPLATLMRATSGGGGGGRGGRTRVALYVTALWVAGGGDHTTQRPASFWARLLRIPSPDSSGARIIRQAWTDLVNRGFISRTDGVRFNDSPKYTLLRETGNGQRYALPTGTGDPYFRVPEKLWTTSLLTAESNKNHETPDGLTGGGLVMYLIALQVAGASRRTESLVFPESVYQRKYGLGEGLRKNGLRNLTALGVLDRDLQPVDALGGVGDQRRRRYVYSFATAFGPPPPVAPKPTTPSPSYSNSVHP